MYFTNVVWEVPPGTFETRRYRTSLKPADSCVWGMLRGDPGAVDHLLGSLGAMGNPVARDLRGPVALCSANPAATRRKCPTHQSPIMIEVPPARIPEEPGAVIPHAGICEGGVGQPTSLP